MTRALYILPVITVALLVSACTMTTPSQVRTGQIQLEEKNITHSYPVADLTQSQLRGIAKDHAARGRGPVSVTVSYMDGSAAARTGAQAQMRDVLADMKAAGLRDVNVHYVGVTEERMAGMAVFDYPALDARAPDHCKRMPGYQGAEGLDAIQDYQISCESKDMLSKMIARPADLLGTAGAGDGTGRRSGAVVETYQDGEPNEVFYQPASASTVGQ